MTLYPRDKLTSGTKVGMALSGTMLDLANPRPEDIHFMDIAYVLTRIPRYNGNTLTKNLWVISDHLCLSGKILEKFVSWGLAKYTPGIRVNVRLHDGDEPYTGDLVTPFKRLLQELGIFTPTKSVAENIRCAIFDRYGVPHLNEECHVLIKDVDLFAFEVEKYFHRPHYKCEAFKFEEITHALVNDPEIIDYCRSQPHGEKWDHFVNELKQAVFEDGLSGSPLAFALAEMKNPYNDNMMMGIERSGQNFARSEDEPFMMIAC